MLSDCPAERELLLRVLSALLREDVAGLRTRSAVIGAADGRWLRLAAGGRRALLLPVRDDGFQCTMAARLPLLRREPEGTDLTTVTDVLTALSAMADPADRRGFDAFAAECRADLLARRLHAATRDELHAHVTARHGADPAHWQGLAASLAFDALAARTDHPVYPASRARPGMTAHQLRSWAPEFHPEFRLRWLALPAEDVTVAGGGAAGRGAAGGPVPGPVLPVPGGTVPGGPGPCGPGEGELPRERTRSHVLLPVHPATAGRPLEEALDAAGLRGRATLLEQPYLEAVPTLSMRTVALAGHPGTHLKLPLPTSTLGLLNRRSIRPGTLRDGAACQRLLERVIEREPRFRGRVLLADETRYASAGHELMSVLVRRLPPVLDDCVVVPLAALAAPGPDGRPVIGSLADRFHGGDVAALLDALLTLLLDWQTTLFGYGIALESHQQNVSLVLGGSGGPGPRLLFKDNDGPRVNTVRLRRALPGVGHGRLGFDDPRICVTEDGPVTDLFTTVTVHLCAGAWAFSPGLGTSSARGALTGLVRRRLAEAVERLAAAHRTAAAVLRSEVLEAPELPVKAMVTAGTLLTKARSGAADINKHYTTGPNYLLRKA
ncbi:siderophore biosynthesis protein [Streptomyces abyssalis]|uniref:Siderophore biosynthesis protein n=1 Tax=Streptomyces abyssalis TaxID=933944 RepID=A0A1E7JQT2_9ACTN|nr:IucA/IucC family siderophore biosynthesis protein [Streptomyces abyssalis]OEU87531.1 siderophore biosynthesis protein [Streptomyces abyssalis]OEU90616.1 siderophore biosynthesis protein [Streptomyces abyssalis]